MSKTGDLEESAIEVEPNEVEFRFCMSASGTSNQDDTPIFDFKLRIRALKFQCEGRANS